MWGWISNVIFVSLFGYFMVRKSVKFILLNGMRMEWVKWYRGNSINFEGFGGFLLFNILYSYRKGVEIM